MTHNVFNALVILDLWNRCFEKHTLNSIYNADLLRSIAQNTEYKLLNRHTQNRV